MARSSHAMRDINSSCTSTAYVPSSAVSWPDRGREAAGAGRARELAVAEPEPDGHHRADDADPADDLGRATARGRARGARRGERARRARPDSA